jgi:hypothetical protein
VIEGIDRKRVFRKSYVMESAGGFYYPSYYWTEEK